MATLSTDRLTRLQRAAIIRDKVLEVGRTSGCWESISLGGGRVARLWAVQGNGWKALIDTPFSGSPARTAVAVASYEEAVLLQRYPPRQSDMVVDLYHPDASKVLSIATADGVDELIGMQPGPWEAAFGLPAREWSPAVARRLDQRAKGRRSA